MRIRRFRKEDARKVSYLIRRALVATNSRDYPESVIRHLCTTFTPGRMIRNARNVAATKD